MSPALDAFGSLRGAIFDKTSRKWHPKRFAKIDTEKNQKQTANGSKIMSRLMPKVNDFHVFSEKAKMHETIVFTIESVTPGT